MRGLAVTTGSAAVTNGGKSVTNGDARSIERTGLALVFAAFAVQTVINALSQIDEHAAAGFDTQRSEIWVWEVSSLIAWTLIVAVIWRVVRRLRPSRIGWPRVVALHLLFTVPVSLAHVAMMVLLRKLAYWAAGDHYVFSNDLAASLLYEFRKDFSTYIAIAGLSALIQWIARRPGDVVDRGPATMTIRDGTRTHVVPLADIDVIEAAGNYVAVKRGDDELLHRATLAACATELAPYGFVRVHRRRIVRVSAVTRTETRPSGDFDLALASGRTVSGSRRYRAALDAAIGA